MAKKRASRKPRGTDSSGQPLDLSDYSQRAQEQRRWMNAAQSYTDSINRGYKGIAKLDMRDMKLGLRNSTDYNRNAPLKKGPFPMGPAKANPMAGRTVEAGTRSMLQGLRSWIRGGGGNRLTGR